MMFQLFSRRRPPLRSSNDHSILPTKRPGSPKFDSWYNSKGSSCLPRRYGRLLVAGAVFLSILGLLYSYNQESTSFFDLYDGTPPSYSKYHEHERNLPQHNLSLPAPEGRHAKFFWARNHVHGMLCLILLYLSPVLKELCCSVWLGKCDAGAAA